MLVYVVGFAPASDEAAVGGFDWYPKRHDAVTGLIRHALDADADHSLTFVPLEVPDGLSPEETTNWINGNLDLVEVSRPATVSGPRVFTIKRSDVARCSIHSLSPSHYRDDGSCLCKGRS